MATMGELTEWWNDVLSKIKALPRDVWFKIGSTELKMGYMSGVPEVICWIQIVIDDKMYQFHFLISLIVKNNLLKTLNVISETKSRSQKTITVDDNVSEELYSFFSGEFTPMDWELSLDDSWIPLMERFFSRRLTNLPYVQTTITSKSGEIDVELSYVPFRNAQRVPYASAEAAMLFERNRTENFEIQIKPYALDENTTVNGYVSLIRMSGTERPISFNATHYTNQNMMIQHIVLQMVEFIQFETWLVDEADYDAQYRLVRPPDPASEASQFHSVDEHWVAMDKLINVFVSKHI